MSFWFLEFLNITSHKAIVQLWSEYRTPEIWMHTKSGLFKFLAITCDQPNYLNSGLIGSVFEWCPKFLQKVQFSDNFWKPCHFPAMALFLLVKNCHFLKSNHCLFSLVSNGIQNPDSKYFWRSLDLSGHFNFTLNDPVQLPFEFHRFDDQTAFNNRNTGLVWYSDLYCIRLFLGSKTLSIRCH